MQDATARVKPRAVLDSNVIISGLAVRRGNPRQILDLLRQGEIEVIISPHIVAEVSRSLRDDFRVRQADIRSEIDLLRSRCLVIDPTREAFVGELTEADNRILDCAVQGEAEYLVTGDHDVQRVGEFRGIRIVSPRQFLDLLHA